MELITKELERRLPPLYSTENIPTADKIVVMKLFTPDSSWTWYAVEYDLKQRLFFGLVVGHETEWGYFSLDELESVKGPAGMPIERDVHFETCTVRQLVKRERLSIEL